MSKIKYLILAIIICLTFSNCRKSSNPITANEANLITLYKPEKTTNSSISLKWSKISDTTFVEYRLNKKYKGFEDIEQNNFITVSNNSNDTSFIDKALYSNKTYSYRIDALIEDGNIISSNTINVKTKNSALACDYDHIFEVIYKNSFKNLGKEIRGIYYHDHDYWILLYTEQGGYNDNNLVEILRYNLESDIIKKQFEINDTYITPQGIVHDNEHIWLAFSNHVNSYLYKLDCENGDIIKKLISNPGIVGITYDDNNILLCSSYNTITKFDPITENFEKEFEFGPDENNSTGISFSNDKIWIAYNQGNLIGIYNNNGLQIGYAKVAEFSDWNDQPRLCFAGEKLIIIENGIGKIMEVLGVMINP